MPRPLKELTLYVLLYVVLVDCLIALVVTYEIFLNTGGSWAQTVVSIAQGVGASVAVTIVVFANVEVLKLLARMYDERRFNEGIEKGRQERDERLEEAYERFGVDLDGVRVLPRTPEIQEFLRGKNGQVS